MVRTNEGMGRQTIRWLNRALAAVALVAAVGCIERYRVSSEVGLDDDQQVTLTTEAPTARLRWWVSEGDSGLARRTEPETLTLELGSTKPRAVAVVVSDCGWEQLWDVEVLSADDFGDPIRTFDLLNPPTVFLQTDLDGDGYTQLCVDLTLLGPGTVEVDASLLAQAPPSGLFVEVDEIPGGER